MGCEVLVSEWSEDFSHGVVYWVVRHWSPSKVRTSVAELNWVVRLCVDVLKFEIPSPEHTNIRCCVRRLGALSFRAGKRLLNWRLLPN